MALKEGLVCYESGRVAVCISGTARESLKRWYVYDEKGTMVCAIDEHAVGFAVGSDGRRLVLTKRGGLLTDGSQIVDEWRWGRHPSIDLKLNDKLSLEFRGRDDIRCRFDDAGKSHEFDMGFKNQAVLNERMTLKERVARAAKRHVRPRAASLTHPETRGIVAGLERDFDGYGPKVPRAFGMTWRAEAGQATTAELPRIALTGDEVGPTVGFGEAIYHGGDGPPRDGPWTLNHVELRHHLMKQNPLLQRSKVLAAASGRYAEDVVVPGGPVSASNPTGKHEAHRRPLPSVAPADLARRARAHQGLLCVACVRSDDKMSTSALAVAETVNYDNTTPDVAVVKCETTVSTHLADEWGVRFVPTFLIFFHGRLVYRGQLGGRRVSVQTRRPTVRVLYVEPNFKNQLHAEKILKAHRRFTWELALDAGQAVRAKRAADAQGIAYDAVLVGAELSADDCVVLQHLFSVNTAVVCGLAALSGQDGAKTLCDAAWTGNHSGLSFDVGLLLPSPLSAMTRLALTTPLKASALDDLADYVLGPSSETNAQPGQLPHIKGLTPASLVAQMTEARAAGQRGAFLDDVHVLATTSTTSAQRLPRWRRRFRPPGPSVTINSLISTPLDNQQR